MKKLISITLMTLSSFAFANSTEQVKSNDRESLPTAVIRIFDTSVTPHKFLEGNKLSRSKPRHICLYVYNVPIFEQNLFAKYVQAPAPITVNVPNAKVEVEDNKKNFLIVFDMMKKDIKDNTPAQCWALGKKDPIGTYKLDVQFNDIVFKNLEFKLLK